MIVVCLQPAQQKEGGRENVLDYLRARKIDLVINIPQV